ncbi:hypothetical protein [Halomarina litorea]|uniref:hypothetical protein n=1 Tax=Halomarina litorea TaxID=2961595 RepID=UPI0020C55A09|nr:hypothetical protein [Halomarina sp. BCD28]
MSLADDLTDQEGDFDAVAVARLLAGIDQPHAERVLRNHLGMQASPSASDVKRVLFAERDLVGRAEDDTQTWLIRRKAGDRTGFDRLIISEDGHTRLTDFGVAGVMTVAERHDVEIVHVDDVREQFESPDTDQRGTNFDSGVGGVYRGP